jgi:hypothetical protein
VTTPARRFRAKELLVGSQIVAQATLRPSTPVRSLDEFLEFLSHLEAVFGRTRRSSRPTTGAHFRL